MYRSDSGYKIGSHKNLLLAFTSLVRIFYFDDYWRTSTMGKFFLKLQSPQ